MRRWCRVHCTSCGGGCGCADGRDGRGRRGGAGRRAVVGSVCGCGCGRVRHCGCGCRCGRYGRWA